MIAYNAWLKIRNKYFYESHHISTIAIEFSLSRNTIRKAIRSTGYWGNKRKKTSTNSKLDKFRDDINKIYREAPYAKSVHILTELRNRGYDGSKTIFYNYLLQIKKERIIGTLYDKEIQSILVPLWIMKSLTGKIHLSHLKEIVSNKINIQDLEKVYKIIKNNTVPSRIKAIALLGYLSGIPLSLLKGYLRVEYKTIKKYIEKYNVGGLEKLFETGWKKVKRYEDVKYKEAIFAIIHAPPSSYGFNRTTWKILDIKNVLVKKGLLLSEDIISKIIKNEGYRFRKAKIVLTSNDPNYLKKVEVIKNILSNLKSNEKFFSIDELGPIAIKIHGGRSLVPKGQIKTIPQWQKSKGYIIITAALELSTNQITHFYSKKKNTKEMIKLLDILIEKYVDEDCIYLSWDAASWHASSDLYDRVNEINSPEYRMEQKLPIVNLAALPSRAQFLNVIESVFSGIIRAIIHNSDYNSVDECMNAIDSYFYERNQKFIINPKRAGNKIWRKEIVKPEFSESNNCKDSHFR
jgi:transposase